MKFFLIIFLLCCFNSAYAKDYIFKCNTGEYSIIIEDTKKYPNNYQYRSWNLPKKTSEKPDLVMEGYVSRSGSGICRANIYRFKSSEGQYIVSNSAACGPIYTPENAIGSVDVVINDEVKNRYWCLTRDEKMKQALAPECEVLRNAAITSSHEVYIEKPWNINKWWNIDINNDGDLDRVVDIGGNTDDFSGSFLIAFVDDKKSGIASLAKMDYNKIMKYIPDNNTPGGMKFHKDLNAYSISLGQAKSSPKYVYNIPFYYNNKYYILAVENNDDKIPAQSIGIIEANNKVKTLCKFPDSKELFWNFIKSLPSD